MSLAKYVGRRILIMTAVEAEREAVLRGLDGDERFDVRLAGVGPAFAAASTAAALAAAGGSCGLVVSAGIAGGFPSRAEIGSLVVSSRIVAADLGAETPDGFASVDALGFGSAEAQPDEALAQQLVQALEAAGLRAACGPILTVSTATGTAQTAALLAERVPGAAAEGMEGYGVAVAARQFGVPALELRAVSNAVGPRDRAAWRIPDALLALADGMAILKEVLPR
ncbi:futalosine hydrolase [Cohnella lubricantis]|uniref:Futalosine hydrolase n=1 Tax=Cohnella lubricantis TaxID=2163172 RepID=A0A841TA48_9BACL|nr:futalosine hydrolase [Cohnella lubricantis]MBB6678373.1 futalosine hydrolase [Cohnella lubricantis]MBP2116753.1 futalosine hydrolase [Cohnella lubricantis]